jgi:hypothetical protein
MKVSGYIRLGRWGWINYYFSNWAYIQLFTPNKYYSWRLY